MLKQLDQLPFAGYTRTFWLVLEQPEGCSGILLRTRVEGTLQTKWGLIAVYPKERVWDHRLGIVI